MNIDLISVIMSTYNETIKELSLSINSILSQTYKRLEFIIINDNPDNVVLGEYLETINDSRVTVIKNEVNLGLVESLNKALKYANGNYIARMDADDISMPNRLELELNYLKEHNLDIVGSDIQLIDEEGKTLMEHMHFPSSDSKARKQIAFGNCMAHPTWLAKKEVYLKLDGYRKVQSCEDYDFLVRLLFSTNFKVGNIPIICLQYRIRNSGISKSSEARQYVLRSYLASNKKKIKYLSQQVINDYIESNEFKKNVKLYEDYKIKKNSFKSKMEIKCLISILLNKYFYKIQIEKLILKKRNGFR